MAGAVNYTYRHLIASAVVAGSGVAGSQGSDNSGKQCILGTVTVNSGAAAATVQVYDYNSLTAPPASQAITGVYTVPAGGLTAPVTLIFGCQVQIGITVVVTGTMDITVCYR